MAQNKPVFAKYSSLIAILFMAILIPFDFLLFKNGIDFARIRIGAIILFSVNIALFNYVESRKTAPTYKLVDIFFLIPPFAFCMIYLYYLMMVDFSEFNIVLVATYLVIFFTTFLIHQFWVEQYILNLTTMIGLIGIMFYRPMLETNIILAIIVLICSAIVSAFFRREFVGNMFLRKSRQDLIMTVDRVESSNKMKNDFLNNMSHELRTPLNAIFGYTDILKMSLEGKINKEEKEYLDSILNGKERILSLVNEMLDLSRVETGSYVLEMREVNPDKIVKEVVYGFKQTISKKNLSIVEAYVDKKNFIHVDISRFKLIVKHLVENAIKFTEKGGITIKSFIDEGKYSLSISDTGIGIKKEFLPYLFIPFRQAEEGISRSFEGAGIGLPLVKHYTNEMDGTLDFTTKEGAGSRFTITFDLSEDATK